MKKCPKCASSSRQRAKRVGVSKYIYGLRTYNCKECKTRYF